jgi:tRNA(adenine34) deaminase
LFFENLAVAFAPEYCNTSNFIIESVFCIRKIFLNIDTDRKWMQEALEEARKAMSDGEVPVGCVIVCGEEVLAASHNERETSGDPTAHAEMLALRKAGEKVGGWRISNTTLYCTLEPCCMCVGAMINARIERLVFGLADPKSGACGSIVNIPELEGLNHSIEVCGGLMSEQSLKLMQDFFKQRR